MLPPLMLIIEKSTETGLRYIFNVPNSHSIHKPI